jgi:hypothetical protein
MKRNIAIGISFLIVSVGMFLAYKVYQRKRIDESVTPYNEAIARLQQLQAG